MDFRDLSKTNRRHVLRSIIRSGGISRSEISRQTGLSKASVTGISDGLMRSGVLCDREIKKSGKAGRPLTVLTLNPNHCTVIVTGYTDDTVWAHLVTPTGNILGTRSSQLPLDAPFKKYQRTQLRIVEQLARNRWSQIQGIGIVGPGLVVAEEGRFLCELKRGWGPGEILKPFERFKKPIFVENNCRLMAMAENWYGAAEDIDDFLYWHLDSGIGGAIVTKGELLIGPSHGAGEFGHIVIDPKGPRCPCGVRGCLEAIASMSAIVKSMKRKSCPSFVEAWQLLQTGDKKARKVFSCVTKAIARAIVNTVIAVGPTTILLGGRIVDQSDGKIVDLIRDQVDKTQSFIKNIDVRSSLLPDNQAAIMGAIAFTLQEMDV